MSLLLPVSVLFASLKILPSSDLILCKVADTNAWRHAAAYSGLREYSLRNMKFAKEATVVVRMTHGHEGKKFTVLKRTGSAQLAGIVERLLASEADASAAAKRSDYEISPGNYRARLRGTDNTAGRLCYVVELEPKRKSKYLIEGTVWVDAASYGIVRLRGTPSASISMWLGAPQVTEEFSEIGGLWLPIHTHAVTSGWLLGTSELEIRYTDYQIHVPSALPAGSDSQTCKR